MVKNITTQKHKTFYLILILFWIFSLEIIFQEELTAQVYLENNENPVKVGKIDIQGNNKTKRDVILRELEFKSGETVSLEEVELARKRIENLNLFNRVIFNFKENEEVRDILILVWERWYILPAIIFNINEHDWGKISYGLGAYHSNFRGRAETLWLSGWLGYNPGLNFSYTNPWFAGRHRLYSSVSLQSQRVESKTLLFQEQKERHRSITFLFGKKYGIHLYTDVEFRLRFINVDEKLRWQSDQNQDRIFTPVFRVQYDTRDLWEYPKNGSRIALSFSRSFLLNKSASYQKFRLDWREFRTFLGVTLAGRIFGEKTQNRLPIYEHLFLGYAERIRGYFNSVFEGENRILSSFEMRVPILKERYYELPSEGLSMSYLQQLKFGMYLTVFRDAGAVWYQDESLQAKHWFSGYGFGLNFILPYSNIFRLEYAFDEAGKSEYIVDVNVAF
jgi:outer membrane protein assembly factor BamA